MSHEDFLKTMLDKKRGIPVPPSAPTLPPPKPSITSLPFFSTIVTTVCILVGLVFLKLLFAPAAAPPPQPIGTQAWKAFSLGSTPYHLNIPSRSCIDVLPTTLSVKADATRQDTSGVIIQNTTPNRIDVEVYLYPIDDPFCQKALHQ